MWMQPCRVRESEEHLIVALRQFAELHMEILLAWDIILRLSVTCDGWIIFVCSLMFIHGCMHVYDRRTLHFSFLSQYSCIDSGTVLGHLPRLTLSLLWS